MRCQNDNAKGHAVLHLNLRVHCSSENQHNNKLLALEKCLSSLLRVLSHASCCVAGVHWCKQLSSPCRIFVKHPEQCLLCRRAAACHPQSGTQCPGTLPTPGLVLLRMLPTSVAQAAHSARCCCYWMQLVVTLLPLLLICQHRPAAEGAACAVCAAGTCAWPLPPLGCAHCLCGRVHAHS